MAQVVPFHRKKIHLTFDPVDADQFAEICCVIARWIGERGFVERVERWHGNTFRVHLALA